MDRLFRVVSACLCGLLLALVVGQARAQSGGEYWTVGSQPALGRFGDAIAACSAEVARLNGLPNATGSFSLEGASVVSEHERRCFGKFKPTSGGEWPNRTIGYVYRHYCPDGDELLPNGLCGKPEPEPPSCPSLGQDMGVGDASHTSAGYTGGLVCINGCSAYPRTAGRGADGTWTAWGPFTSVGVSCQGGTTTGGNDPAPDIQEPPQRCPSGQCRGSFNGQNICVPCSSGQDRPPPKSSDTTTNNPDGSTTTTNTQSDTRTECQGASCTTTTTRTTTTTTTPAGGGTPSTQTKTETTAETEPRDDFCTENPRSSMCLESTFGGSCSAAFRCEGDAVQCAMARDQHIRACELMDTETTESGIGRSAASGNLTPDGHPGLEAEQSVLNLQGRINTAPAFGGSAGCPADVTVGEYQIRLSGLCPYLDVIRPAVIGFAWLIAAFVVFRRR